MNLPVGQSIFEAEWTGVFVHRLTVRGGFCPHFRVGGRKKKGKNQSGTNKDLSSPYLLPGKIKDPWARFSLIKIKKKRIGDVCRRGSCGTPAVGFLGVCELISLAEKKK